MKFPNHTVCIAYCNTTNERNNKIKYYLQFQTADKFEFDSKLI